MKYVQILAALFGIVSSASATEMNHSHAGHVDHAAHATGGPIGVMGEHLHPKGDWMVSYRFMRMDMEGNLRGNDSISISEIISPTGENFLVVPTKMTMDMHMVGLMYAPTDNLTLMGMVPYIDNSMDHRTRMGATFTTDSKGIGDVKLMALYGLKTWDGEHLHLNLGIGVPTGSIDKKDNTPMGRVRLPYPMQLGSGT